MKTYTLNKKQLDQGSTITFETKDKENIRTAEIDRSQKGRAYRLYFNGAFLFVGATFKGLQNRFDKLCTAWDLEPCVEEDLEN